jgi:DNA-binding PadR family transcriptional regulator
MSEARLLSLVLRYSHPTALARRVRDGSVIAALRRLEDRGLVRRARGSYRLTARGRDELAMIRRLALLAARTRSTGPAAATRR